jgi:hypothetical protein
LHPYGRNPAILLGFGINAMPVQLGGDYLLRETPRIITYLNPCGMSV